HHRTLNAPRSTLHARHAAANTPSVERGAWSVERTWLSLVLLEERRDRTHDAGGSGQNAGHDPARVDCGTERAAPHLRVQRLEQRVTGLRHAAGDDHAVRIERVEQVRDPRAEE